MYDSDESRDGDIAALAGGRAERHPRPPAGRYDGPDDAFAAVPDDRWETRVERTPGGRSMRAASFPGMRLRELEIHHVDLGAGYTTPTGPRRSPTLLVDAMAKRLEPPERLEMRPLDVDRTWIVGPDARRRRRSSPVPAADLGWWLTGRPAPDTLSCSRGELPEIEGW